MDCVSHYTNSGITVISELVTMVTWVVSFAMVWTVFVEESERGEHLEICADVPGAGRRAPDAAGCYPSTRRSTSTSASTADGCVAQLVAKRMTVWDSSGFSQKQYTTCLRSSGSTASSTTANTWFVGAS